MIRISRSSMTRCVIFGPLFQVITSLLSKTMKREIDTLAMHTLNISMSIIRAYSYLIYIESRWIGTPCKVNCLLYKMKNLPKEENSWQNRSALWLLLYLWFCLLNVSLPCTLVNLFLHHVMLAWLFEFF